LTQGLTQTGTLAVTTTGKTTTRGADVFALSVVEIVVPITARGQGKVIDPPLENVTSEGFRSLDE
jgi:hypothetical protein